ncbi:hypothetical protein LINGRAHAP2_LOCUS33351 [Linum grandiflorum]
MIPPAAAS